MGFRVRNKGLLTLIQGGKRIGYQQYGVPVSGCMDEFSHRLSNILVGNKEDEACLEILMVGPEIIFDKDTKIAITGANINPKINYADIRMHKSYIVKRGDILSFGICENGCRSYVAFEGGIDVDSTMGSKSTYTKASMGGHKGRALIENDTIKLFDLKDQTINTIDAKYIETYSNEITLRIIKGPQDDMFLEGEFEKFLNSEYTVTNECDRMGYRLEGESIKHIDGADIVSDGIAFGAIQIPGHGKPIIMMSDRQTVGGYTKIANVISVDLNKLAQAKPNDKIRFEEVDIYKAHELLKEYEEKISNIKESMKKQEILQSRNIIININGVVYNTVVEDVK